MKRFLHKILFIFLLSIVFFALNITINSSLIKNDPFVTKPKINTLIVGDSHLQSGLNDAIIDSSVNVCKGAENYFITYHKLIYILNHNKNINKVILGFSPHNFTIYNDFKFKEKPWKTSTLTAYAPILSYSDIKKEFLIDNTAYCQAIFRNYLIPNFYYYKNFIFQKDKSYLYNGVQHLSNKTNVNDSLLLIKQSNMLFHYKNKNDITLSTKSLKYFEKIIDLLEKRNIKIVLISTPLHPKLSAKVPKKTYMFFNTLKSEYSIKKNILVLDYSNYNMKDKYFGDFHHLNKKGAILFSNEIKKNL